MTKDFFIELVKDAAKKLHYESFRADAYPNRQRDFDEITKSKDNEKYSLFRR